MARKDTYNRDMNRFLAATGREAYDRLNDLCKSTEAHPVRAEEVFRVGVAALPRMAAHSPEYAGKAMKLLFDHSEGYATRRMALADAGLRVAPSVIATHPAEAYAMLTLTSCCALGSPWRMAAVLQTCLQAVPAFAHSNGLIANRVVTELIGSERMREARDPATFVPQVLQAMQETASTKGDVASKLAEELCVNPRGDSAYAHEVFDKGFAALPALAVQNARLAGSLAGLMRSDLAGNDAALNGAFLDKGLPVLAAMTEQNVQAASVLAPALLNAARHVPASQPDVLQACSGILEALPGMEPQAAGIFVARLTRAAGFDDRDMVVCREFMRVARVCDEAHGRPIVIVFGATPDTTRINRGEFSMALPCAVSMLAAEVPHMDPHQGAVYTDMLANAAAAQSRRDTLPRFAQVVANRDRPAL